MKCVAWGITGAGHFISETFDVMTRLAAKPDIKITTYITNAGSEIVRMYGLRQRLEKISIGSYYSEIISDADDGYGSPSTGRLMRGKYALLVVAPSSANTTAKIVHGISDTVVTNAVAQAMKSRTPVLILPSEECKELVETTLPYRIESSACRSCHPCPAAQSCPCGAIGPTDRGEMRIDLRRCNACGICLGTCSYGAARFKETAPVFPRQMDTDMIRQLKSISGLSVVQNPVELEQKIGYTLKGDSS